MNVEKALPDKVAGHIDTSLSCLLVSLIADYNGTNTEVKKVFLATKIDKEEWVLTKLTAHTGWNGINHVLQQFELLDNYVALPEGYKIILTQ